MARKNSARKSARHSFTAAAQRGAPVMTEAEAFLSRYDINYRMDKNGVITVPGDINLFDKDLARLPDLSDVVVLGNFLAGHNKLTSLAGCPRIIDGMFDCSENKLTTLAGGPTHVGDDYCCNSNELVSLKGMPGIIHGTVDAAKNRLASLDGCAQHIGKTLYCDNNILVTLSGGPQSVGANYHCHRNRLVTLEGIAQDFSGELICDKNPLAHLEGVPESCVYIQSDLGRFNGIGTAPEDVRYAPRTLEALRRTKAEAAQEARRQLAILQRPLHVKPIRLKKPRPPSC